MAPIETGVFTDREAFVWLGFRRDASLDFRVALPRDETEAKRIVMAVPCYNRFDPDEVWRIIDGWREYVMRVEIGREGSVVLYMTFPWYQHQALSNHDVRGAWLGRNTVPVPTETCRVFASQLQVELAEAGAFETSYDVETRTVRAWWD